MAVCIGARAVAAQIDRTRGALRSLTDQLAAGLLAPDRWAEASGHLLAGLEQAAAAEALAAEPYEPALLQLASRLAIARTGLPGYARVVARMGPAERAAVPSLLAPPLLPPFQPLPPPGPSGPAGRDGSPGQDGAAGKAATIEVGTTTTGPPGSDAAVRNVGTPHAAILALTLPRGVVGPAGPPGPPGRIGPAGLAGGSAVRWAGAWRPDAPYAAGDIVGYGGGAWVARRPTRGEPPTETPSAWDLVAAPGEVGPVGPRGPRGLPGKDGQDGRDGAPGRDGQDGAPGARGSRGPAGRDGAPGPVGRDGAPGVAGPQGPRGETGSPGPRGPEGRPGPPGSVAIVGGGGGGAGVPGPPGLVWRGDWSAAIRYQPPDAVAYNGSSYVATAISENAPPDLHPESWDLLAQGGGGDGGGSPGPPGPPGPAGPAGAAMLSGSGVPSDSLGHVGDSYVDVDTGNTYLKS
jgi:hypothetical protein